MALKILIIMFYWTFNVNTIGFAGGYVSAEPPTILQWSSSKLVGLTIKMISVSAVCDYSITIGGVGQNPILPCVVRGQMAIEQFPVRPIVQVAEAATVVSGNGGVTLSNTLNVDNLKDFNGDVAIPLNGNVFFSLAAYDDPALVMAVRSTDISFFSLEMSLCIGYEYSSKKT
jgi:hypothetical protein